MLLSDGEKGRGKECVCVCSAASDGLGAERAAQRGTAARLRVEHGQLARKHDEPRRGARQHRVRVVRDAGRQHL